MAFSCEWFSWNCSRCWVHKVSFKITHLKPLPHLLGPGYSLVLLTYWSSFPGIFLFCTNPSTCCPKDANIFQCLKQKISPICPENFPLYLIYYFFYLPWKFPSLPNLLQFYTLGANLNRSAQFLVAQGSWVTIGFKKWYLQRCKRCHHCWEAKDTSVYR